MPLTFDLPLDRLQTYTGRNPKPRDFDAFWERGLEEVRKTDPQMELRPASFKSGVADCFDLFFTGVGGARVHAKLLQPRSARGGKGKHPAVLMFHGYSGSAGDWYDKLGYVSQGFVVAAMDCRGQGGQSQDTGGTIGQTLRGHIIRGIDGPPEKLLFRQIFLDTVQLARVVMAMPEVDPARVGATGASQGGGLTLACASLEPGIKRAAPVYPFLTDYRRTWEMDQAKDAYQELRDYFRQFDPNHEREDEVFTKLGYVDVQHLAPRIQGEVLMVTGLMDTICPPSTQFAAYNKIKSRKSMAIYPDFGHETLPRNADRIFEFLSGL
jgi:cephalosporin-C deacetylase